MARRGTRRHDRLRWLLTTALPCLALLTVALTGSWRQNVDWGSFGFQHFEKIFTDSYAMKGLANSFTLGVVAATIVVVVAALVSLYRSTIRARCLDA